MKKRLLTANLCLIGVLTTPVFAHQSAPQSGTSSDNTKVNKRDQKTPERTADQGSNASTDRETMRKIRRAVVQDKTLSTYGHNVKIIAEHGKVTLKGPVHSEDEKKAIEAKAVEIAGVGNVVNEITVKGDAK